MQANKEPQIVTELREQEKIGIFTAASNVLEISDMQNQEEMPTSKIFLEEHKEHDFNFGNLDILINATEHSPAIIIITDIKGNITYVNPKFIEVTGFSSDDVIGKNPRILQTGKQSKEFYQNLWDTITSGKVWVGEFHNKKKNGDAYWEHASISPISDTDGTIKYFVAIKEEITSRKEMEYNLRIKENALLSSINAIVLTDLDGNITYVNPSFLGMWGYDSEKRVIGQPVFSLWRRGGEYVRILDTVTHKGGWLGEIVARGHNNRLFPVQMSASMVKDEFDKPLCMMASFVDITKQKRLEKKFKKFKTISDEADYGSIIYDLEGTILYVNNSFSKMHGYNSTDILGENLTIFYPDQNKHDLSNLFDKLKQTGKILGREIWHQRKDGNQFPLLMTSTVIKDAESANPYIAGTVVDITERKEAEKKIMEHAEELRKVNDELQLTQDELALLNQNLEQKVKERTYKIEQLINQKDGFINQLSHDLKTPLTPMMVLLPMFKKTLSNEEDIKMLDIIIRNSHYMKDLVDKTIDLAKLNSDNVYFEFDEINLFELVSEVINNNKVLFEEQKVNTNISIDEQVTVYANELRLNEVFTNLITNSAKYMSEEGGGITVSVEEKSNEVIISIIDTGIGMTKDQTDHIFDEFYKADQSRHDHDSTGLGLTITKKIIEKHGGTIWAESKGLGKGSTFTFILKKPKHRNKNKKQETES